MKIAVSGKGGVGKTTLSAMLAWALDLGGSKVIAVDADPDANLASALGVDETIPLTPLAEMHEMMEERTGHKKETFGGFFTLNPTVDDIPEKFARCIDNIHLLVLGGVSKGGGGCICPATTVLKALLVHLVLGRDEAIIMDMEAGIEHLGRATAQSMDALILVVDEGPWSIATAQRVRKLADDLGLAKLFAVVNRVSDSTDLKRIEAGLDGIPIIGQLPNDCRLSSSLAVQDNGTVRPSQALKEHLPVAQSILARLKKEL